jgi:rhodanese-related sulfurtransferase
LPGSTLLPLSELAERLEDIAEWKADDVVVYCHHGIRSAHAIAFLRGQGFTKLANLTGGIDRWSSEVDPCVPRY